MTEVRRSGRPPGTSARELELAAMRLFVGQGYEDTTVAQIAAAAGVSGRTFFRYFESKPDVLWGAFDDEVAAIRSALADLPADLPVMTAVRQAGARREPLPAHRRAGAAAADDADRVAPGAGGQRGRALRGVGAGGA